MCLVLGLLILLGSNEQLHPLLVVLVLVDAYLEQLVSLCGRGLARELESNRHAHLFLGSFKHCRIVIAHDAIVHEILDRVFSVDHFGAILSLDHEEWLIN